MSDEKKNFRDKIRNVNVEGVFDKNLGAESPKQQPKPQPTKTESEPPKADAKPKNYEEAIDKFKPTDIIDKDGKLFKNKLREAERKKQKAEKELGATKTFVDEMKATMEALKKEVAELKGGTPKQRKEEEPIVENDDEIDESLMYVNPAKYKQLLQEKLKKEMLQKEEKTDVEKTDVEKTKDELVTQIKEAVDTFGDKFNINSDDFIDLKENFKVSDAVILKNFKDGNIASLLSEKEINKIVEKFLNSDEQKTKDKPPFNLSKGGSSPVPENKKLNYDVKKGFKSKEVQKVLYDAFDSLSGDIK